MTPLEKFDRWSKLTDGRGKTLYTEINGEQLTLLNVEYKTSENKIKFKCHGTCSEILEKECKNKELDYKKYLDYNTGSYFWEIPVSDDELWVNLSLNYYGGRRRPPSSIKKSTRLRNIRKNKQTRSSKMKKK